MEQRKQGGEVRVAVCDDEAAVRKLLTEYTERFAKAEGVTVGLSLYKSGEELLQVDYSLFDLLYLDIQMPGIDGMETARTIRRKSSGLRLVFITNYEQYAIEGYEVQAFRFLKKPIDYGRFCDVTRKTIASIKKDNGFVAIKSKSGMRHLNLTDITYCETSKRHVLIHTTGGNVDSTLSMKSLEEALGDRFFRCHTAYLVNLRHIKEVLPGTVVLSDGSSIPVSKHRRTSFLEKVMKHWGESLL